MFQRVIRATQRMAMPKRLFSTEGEGAVSQSRHVIKFISENGPSKKIQIREALPEVFESTKQTGRVLDELKRSGLISSRRVRGDKAHHEFYLTHRAGTFFAERAKPEVPRRRKKEKVQESEA